MKMFLTTSSYIPPESSPAFVRANETKVTWQQVSTALHKARQGIRLSAADGIALFYAPDLAEIGAVANEINFKKNGRDVLFNVNRHLNPSNICALSCKFCAFQRKPGQEGAYELSLEEIAERAEAAEKAGATEIHMTGGLHPRWNFSHYLKILMTAKKAAPSVSLKAFTAVEVDWLSRKERKTHAEILTELRLAGLSSLTGGGAEIFDPLVRNEICDTKLSAEGWLAIHQAAHEMGIRTTSTMLYGHLEDVTARVDHMLRLRALQDQTHGFNVFIPLAFQPENNALNISQHTSAVDDLKTIAVARLMLDNFTNIKAYWVMLGAEVAQTALHFGANDLDGTVVEERIANMAGSRGGMEIAKQDLLTLIRAADRTPVERTTQYEHLQRYDL